VEIKSETKCTNSVDVWITTTYTDNTQGERHPPAKQRGITMSKHTPGPWLVCDQFKIKTWSGATVALPISNAASNPEQYSANAYLMASAPDLLRERKKLLYTPGNGVAPESHPAALAAIAKAENRLDDFDQSINDLVASGGIVGAP
jgi:hypothetical protein